MLNMELPRKRDGGNQVDVYDEGEYAGRTREKKNSEKKRKLLIAYLEHDAEGEAARQEGKRKTREEVYGCDEGEHPGGGLTWAMQKTGGGVG